METIPLKVKLIPSPCGRVETAPAYQTTGSAAVDLRANIDCPVVVPAGKSALIPSGLALELPSSGYVALVFARSGLAVKYGLCLSNGVGVVDSDYRGEIRVGVVNLSETDFVIAPGDRIAQLAVMPVCTCRFEIVSELQASPRGEGGFGSTGRS